MREISKLAPHCRSNPTRHAWSTEKFAPCSQSDLRRNTRALGRENREGCTDEIRHAKYCEVLLLSTPAMPNDVNISDPKVTTVSQNERFELSNKHFLIWKRCPAKRSTVLSEHPNDTVLFWRMAASKLPFSRSLPGMRQKNIKLSHLGHRPGSEWMDVRHICNMIQKQHEHKQNFFKMHQNPSKVNQIQFFAVPGFFYCWSIPTSNNTFLPSVLARKRWSFCSNLFGAVLQTRPKCPRDRLWTTHRQKSQFWGRPCCWKTLFRLIHVRVWWHGVSHEFPLTSFQVDCYRVWNLKRESLTEPNRLKYVEWLCCKSA